MKKIIFFVVVIPLIIFAQPDRQTMKKIDELEKIKLMEVLKLDDATMLKFFNKRNDFHEKMREFGEQKDEKLDQLEKALNENNSSKIKSLISEIDKLEDNLCGIRKIYLNSLSEILDEKQLAKLLVFEKNFRKEIRDIIFKERKRGHN